MYSILITHDRKLELLYEPTSEDKFFGGAYTTNLGVSALPIE